MKNADDYERDVVFTAPAKADLAWLARHGFSKDDWQRLKANLIKTARLPDVLDNEYVCELRMCGKHDPTWYRLRLSHLRSCNQSGVRVAFEVDEKTLTCHAVLCRNDSTYIEIALRLKTTVKGKARR